MSKHDLIVAAKETEYVRRLADYVRGSAFGESWRVTAFTHPSAFRQYIKGGYPVDIIAAQPGMLDEIRECAPAVPIASLVTSVSKQTGEVMQYQPLPELLKLLVTMHSGSEQLLSGSIKNRGNVITVYDSVGGLGKTTLAMCLAKQAGTTGDRVFYLNLEQWNVTHLLLGGESDTGMSDTLYMLHTQPEAASDKLDELKKRSSQMKADYFAPGANPEERISMKPEDARKLIELLVESGRYDLVIVDMDSRMDALTLEVFERSDAVIWLVGESETSCQKTELTIQYAKWKFKEAFGKVEGKIRYVSSRQSERASDSRKTRFQSNLRINVELPWIAEWGGDGHEVWTTPPHYRGAVERLLETLGREEGHNRAGGRSGEGAANTDTFTPKSERLRFG